MQVLGYIARTHGVLGQVLVKGSSNYELTTEEPVFVDIQGPVPFFIETLKKGSGGFIIQFEWIDSMEKAEKLVGKEVLIEAMPEEDDSEVYPIIGFTLKDLTSGTTGSVVDVRPLNHHPLLIVEVNGAEVMIPFVDEMIDEVNDQEKTISMNLPEGLLDL
jgi:16S rRNA processing protein RimM